MQVYLHDRAASVVRPVQQLVAAARVDLAAGERAEVRFALHADLTSFTGRDLVRLVEPGAVATELSGHNRPEVRESIAQRFADIERLEAEDVADAVAYVVTRRRRVAVNEVLIRPTEQEA